jgi:hypothetical protein
MATVFLSKSHLSREKTQAMLVEALGRKNSVVSEDAFRPYQNTPSPREAWSDQFNYTRRCEVMAVLLAEREGMSQGQQTEILDADLRGVPIVWCKTSPDRYCRAETLHLDMLINPYRITYLCNLFDPARPLAAELDAMKEWIDRVSKIPRTIDLPDRFRRGIPLSFRCWIRERTPDGCQLKDLSASCCHPTLEFFYGKPTLQYIRSRAKEGEMFIRSLPLTIATGRRGVVDGSINLSEAGTGHVRLSMEADLQWETRDEELQRLLLSRPDYGRYLRAQGGKMRALQWDFECY